jgi:hypothetical protein
MKAPAHALAPIRPPTEAAYNLKAASTSAAIGKSTADAMSARKNFAI